MQKTLSTYTLLRPLSIFIAGVALFLLPTQLIAADFTQTTIKKSALTEKTVVTNPFGTAEVVIKPNSFEATGKITMQLAAIAQPAAYPTTGKDRLISSIYSYQTVAVPHTKLKRKVGVMLSYAATAKEAKKIIKFWDPAQKTWKPVITKDIHKHLQARAGIKRKTAVIAVFEKYEEPKEQIVYGTASWYNWHGAANNVFPMGARIRVTNTTTGAFVDTTIVSSGPFVPGRVVDLPKQDFAKIAPVSAGLAPVKVQLAP